MKYGIIDPHARLWHTVDCESFEMALRAAGLRRGEIDFGSVCRGLEIVVDEYSLMQERQAYFGLLGGLYGGGAVLFQVDGEGATVDFQANPFLMGTLQFFADAAEAEAAIRRLEVERPTQSVNGVVTWEWRP